MGRLDKIDLSLKLSDEEEAKRLDAGWARLEALRLALGGKLQGYGLGPPVCVLFEGWDASGKGGAIKRLVRPFDLRHVRVAQFSAPTPDEKRHHYLQRFWPVLPGIGGMTILDRSWYGRVVVERVEGFASEAEWRRAYGEIEELERSLAAGGMVLIKFFMHISEEEQLERFEKRRDDPVKAWKLTEEDWHNRTKRPEYLEAVEDMVERTDHEVAPWHLVEAESKKYARVKVVETVISRIEQGMRDAGIEPPAVGTLRRRVSSSSA
jgi:AMP-polyphosphate phosphotransferase